MESHVKILGWLWLVVGVLSIIGGICLGGAIAGGGLISDDQTAILPTAITGSVFGVLLGLSGLIDILVGVGLLKFKGWGRILAIIKGILDLPLFPIGTALGIYALVVMFNKETKQLFE